jgi:hypothetical protein
MPLHWRPPRVRLRWTSRGRNRTWGVRRGPRLVWLRWGEGERKRARFGGSRAELRKESVVKVSRDAELIWVMSAGANVAVTSSK